MKQFHLSIAQVRAATTADLRRLLVPEPGEPDVDSTTRTRIEIELGRRTDRMPKQVRP